MNCVCELDGEMSTCGNGADKTLVAEARAIEKRLNFAHFGVGVADFQNGPIGPAGQSDAAFVADLGL